MKGNILVVDDEQDINDLIKDILEDEGYIVHSAANSSEVFKQIKLQLPDIIILDIWLQGSELDGLGILEILTKDLPNLPIIMISGHGNIETAVSAIKIGAYDYIEKPFSEEKLTVMVQRAMELNNLRIENANLKLHIVDNKEFIGSSAESQKIRKEMDKLAKSSSRVLITGAVGTGKSLIAQKIHLQANNKNNPFIMFDAYNKDILEEEFFGQDTNRGLAYKKNIFELAKNGTLYLKSIERMSIQMQTRLLKFLHDGEERYNVRIIASTTENLHNYIKKGLFREDLYYRLNISSLHLPLLSERVQDLPDLIDYYLNFFHEHKNYKKITLDASAVVILQTYSWPGNIRQLKNILEWLVIMYNDEDNVIIKPNMLPLDLLNEPSSDADFTYMMELSSLSLKEAREAFEKKYLKIQLKRFDNNISKIANAIGMERSALHRKLKTLDIVYCDE
jgi:two-component system, NtrC family, nitrogen regulation response regulator NtrX